MGVGAALGALSSLSVVYKEVPMFTERSPAPGCREERTPASHNRTSTHGCRSGTVGSNTQGTMCGPRRPMWYGGTAALRCCVVSWLCTGTAAGVLFAFCAWGPLRQLVCAPEWY